MTMTAAGQTISSATAALLSIGYTLIYVIPFYLWKRTRPSPTILRDSPAVISARIRSVTLSCAVTSLITAYVAVQHARLGSLGTLHLLGWWPVVPYDIVQTLALVAILFLGPLFEAGVVEGRWQEWLSLRHVRGTVVSWTGYRNYVAGPVTEELTFRSALIPLHVLAQLSPSRIVFITPLYFGIAHVHHFYEYTLTNPSTSLLPALFRSLFQFTYTSLFGFFAAFVYLRTGSLAACILAHSFCNWMGLPRFWGRLEASEYPSSSGPGRTRPAGSSYQVADDRLGIGWTVAYYCLLVTGAVGFYMNLWSLTESPNALIAF